MTTQAAIGGDTRTWDDYASQFVEFMNPRVLMAGKLALRGVQINSYPLNMAACSEFTPLSEVTGLSSMETPAPEPCGWAPIVCYIPPSNPQLALEALVTTEWRVRFDLTNPASAGHIHHPLASDATWESLVRKAVALGNGVIDISDVVANAGQAVAKVGRVLPALGL